MGVESINKKDNGELGIMFSKMWSENIPLFSYKTSGVIHPEGLHLTPQSSENLLISAGILV
jgi:hypothetical protein